MGSKGLLEKGDFHFLPETGKEQCPKNENNGNNAQKVDKNRVFKAVAKQSFWEKPLQIQPIQLFTQKFHFVYSPFFYCTTGLKPPLFVQGYSANPSFPPHHKSNGQFPEGSFSIPFVAAP